MPPLALLDAAWVDLGIIAQSSKAYDLVDSVVALGIQLHRGTSLLPKNARLRDLICDGIDLMMVPVTSPRSFSSFGGMLQWKDLFARPLFSCFGFYYALT